MSDRSDTWMPFYVGDYLSATGRLTTEQHGAYLLILIDYWKNGPPPNDDAVLASLTRLSPTAWKKAKAALIGFFEVRDGMLIQKRVERERGKAADITEERSKAGKAGAEKRWGKRKQNDGNEIANAIDLPLANEQQNDGPSQSPSSVDKSTGGEPPADPLKELFDLGVSILTAAGNSEKQARSLIGKWRAGGKNDANVLTALLDCRSKAISEPIEWLTRRLQAAKWVSASGYEYRGSDVDVMREAEKRHDMATYWAVKRALAEQPDKPKAKRTGGGTRPIGQLLTGITAAAGGN